MPAILDRLKLNRAARKELRASGNGMFHRGALDSCADAISDVYQQGMTKDQLATKVKAHLKKQGAEGKWIEVVLKILEMFGPVLIRLLESLIG